MDLFWHENYQALLDVETKIARGSIKAYELVSPTVVSPESEVIEVVCRAPVEQVLFCTRAQNDLSFEKPSGLWLGD
jgi:hypothetical protein